MDGPGRWTPPSSSRPHSAPGARSLRGRRPLRLAGSAPARPRRGVAWTPGPPATEQLPAPSHTRVHLARGYLRGRDSAQPIGRPPAALAVDRGVMTGPWRPRRARPGARAVLSGVVLGRREEPAAALEAGDELGVLQAPQQLGHGAPGAAAALGPLPAPSPPVHQPPGSRGGERARPGHLPTGAPLGS